MADASELPKGPPHRMLAALSLVAFVSMLGYGLLIPVLPYFGMRIGASPTMIAVALSAYALGQLIAAPLWGRLGDRIGRRPVLIWTTALEVVALIAMAMCVTMPALIAVRFVSGLFAGNLGAVYACVTDVTTADTRAKAIGWIGAASGLGFIFGPGLGGLIAGTSDQQAGFVRVCLAAATVQAVAGVCAFKFVPESRIAEAAGATGSQSHIEPLVRAGAVLRRLFGISFLISLSIALLEGTFTLWAANKLGWGPTQVGLIFVLMGLVAIGVQGLLVGRLVDRFGERAVFVSGGSLLTIGLILLERAEDSSVVYVALGVLEAGLGLLMPALASLTAREAPEQARGLILGVSETFAGVGRVAGPVAGGLLYQFMSTAAAFQGAAIASGFALALIITILVSGQRARSPTA